MVMYALETYANRVATNAFFLAPLTDQTNGFQE